MIALKDLAAALPTLSEEERATVLGALMKKLTGVSVAALSKLQKRWDGRRPFSEFIAEQNKVFAVCIAMELSQVGQDVRKVLGLPILDPEELLPTSPPKSPPYPLELLKYEESDIDTVTAHSRAAGIEVQDTTTKKEGN